MVTHEPRHSDALEEDGGIITLFEQAIENLLHSLIHIGGRRKRLPAVVQQADLMIRVDQMGDAGGGRAKLPLISIIYLHTNSVQFN